MSGRGGGADVDMDDVLNFMAVTGATQDVATKFIGAASGDLDTAVANFFESGGGEASDPAAPAASAGEGGRAPQDAASSAVDSIVGRAKETSQTDDEARRWGEGAPLAGGAAAVDGKGKAGGKGKGKPANMRTVGLLFFADGFCIDETLDDAKEDDAEAAAPTPKPAPRRTGMATLDDFKKSPGGPGAMGMGRMPKIPKLPPVRSYDSPSDKAVLDELKGGGVPKELQKRDEQTGEPIGVSLAVQDMRPKTYKELSELVAKFEKMSMQDGGPGGASSGAAPPASSGPQLFSGAGQTLSAPGPAAGPATGPGAAPGAGGGGGADPALLALAAGGAAPSADEALPATTLQLRLASGARARVRLNLEHTVADLWRVVAAHMGPEAFAAASGHELSAGFPPKPLADPSVTLAAADLANAVVTHRCR